MGTALPRYGGLQTVRDSTGVTRRRGGGQDGLRLAKEGSAMKTIHLAAGRYKAERRRHGRINYGFYCTSCDEFFAVAVAPEGVETDRHDLTFEFEVGAEFECPFCHQVAPRQVSELARILLNEGNKRRPPRPKNAH
jgi:hypothetical protein